MVENLPNEILAAATDIERLEYKIIRKAVIKSAKAYSDEPSKQRKQAWGEAKQSLSEQESYLMEKYGAEQPIPETFATQQEVLTYLKAGGYKLEKSALSNHVRSRILVKKDGAFPRQAVDRYAELHLQDAAGGQTAADKKSAALQERKLRAEIMRTEEQAHKARLEREAMEGKLINRADVELEMAGRALILDAGLKGLIRAKAAAWIDLTTGDQARAPELIAAIQTDLDTMLGDYATASFRVGIAARQVDRDSETG